MQPMNWYTLSDPAILLELGKRIKEYRLRRNMTQKILAVRSGISVLSVQNLEKGQPVSMLTFLSVLRSLRIFENLESLLPELPLSPVELLKLQGKHRQRASKSAVKKKN